MFAVGKFVLLVDADDPVFRDLGNSTVVLVNQISNLSIKESTAITNLRVPAHFLANIITRSPPINSPEIAQYLKHIGNLLFILGTFTEKMQNTGKFFFKEIEIEFTTIYQNLQANDILRSGSTKKSFILSRMNTILDLVTDLRDRAKDVVNALDEFEELYQTRIESHETDEKGGFSKVEDHFKINREELNRFFEISDIQLGIEELRTGIRGVLIFKTQSKNIMKFVDNSRKDLIRIKESFGKMIRGKVVTEQDLEVLAHTIEIIQNMKNKWKRNVFEGHKNTSQSQKNNLNPNDKEQTHRVPIHPSDDQDQRNPKKNQNDDLVKISANIKGDLYEPDKFQSKDPIQQFRPQPLYNSVFVNSPLLPYTENPNTAQFTAPAVPVSVPEKIQPFVSIVNPSDQIIATNPLVAPEHSHFFPVTANKQITAPPATAVAGVAQNAGVDYNSAKTQQPVAIQALPVVSDLSFTNEAKLQPVEVNEIAREDKMDVDY
ncbi:13210_t:CDS:2 [Ambispora leptoticha]|uniref:13210_t:CDS:1 n=1 Tax=Ambispora leptoticha TaxID=144679 RepID=A0A9N9FGK5_9GLOM|nr:13210_t:CDS:2 [Ambispora leptoticha]